jgi:hypothetical protein
MVYKRLSKLIKDIRKVNMKNRISFFDYRVQAYLYIYLPKRDGNSLRHVEIYANSFATNLKSGRLKNAVVLISEIKNGYVITRHANKEEKEYWTNLFNIAYEIDKLKHS